MLGWGISALLSLETPAYIAMLLLAACPGAPFGVKMVMNARGHVVKGASLQVLLAVVGTFTFPIVANAMIGAAGLGDDFSLPVADLIKTVAVLQLIPFGLGIAVRHWTPETADKWRPPVTQISNYALMLTVVLALLGTWRMMIESLGTFVLLAGVIFSVVIIVVGWFMAVGGKPTRISTSMIEPVSNTGPVYAAVAIGFNNDPAILSATTMLLFVQVFVAVFVASYLGKKQPTTEEASITEASTPMESS